MNPYHLTCEYSQNPLGIDVAAPELGWWLEANARGQLQSAYQVVVATSSQNLDSGHYDLWDSGKVASGQSAHVEYSGKALAAGTQAFWKVRCWDQLGHLSAWSKPNVWSMGLLQPSDWKGQWIAATNRLTVTGQTSLTGFHALEATASNDTKWVQVDLGSDQPIDAVILHKPSPSGFETRTGFGFPHQFRIEVSDNPAMANPKVIVDHTRSDYSATGNDPESFSAHAVHGRYVRVTATKLWNRQSGPAPYCFALSELEVISGKRNAAQGAKVSAKDSVENGEWAMSRLTDGKSLETMASTGHGDPGNAAVMLRKEFENHGKLVRATAYLCGLGYSELMINGRKIGDHVLDPGFTDFSRRSLYVTYDVTKEITEGQNAVGILLGGGWFNLGTPDLFGFENAPWAASPRARLNLTLEYQDGSQQTIVTDPTWKWSTGTITFNSVRGGETIDGRADQPGWSTTGFSARNWKPAVSVSGPTGKPVAQQHPPIRAHGSIRPVKISSPKPGVYLFDFGVNIAGWATLRTRGPKGTHVTFEYNEALNPDGTVNMRHTASHTYGRFQTDEFILAGTGIEEFEPRFTYHGFQYVQVTGLTEKPSFDTVTAKWVTTDQPIAGHFSCSDVRINKLQELIHRTTLNNMHGIPTDCPQREKMGWMDDGCVMMETAFMNFDSANFYRKWIHDMLDSQDANGHVPDIVPTDGWGKSHTGNQPGEMADPWWGGAVVLAPWKLYQQFGDTRILRESYAGMKAYVDYLTSTAQGHLIPWGLGDWLDDSAGGGARRVSVPQTSTAAYFYTAQIVSQAASVLGMDADAKQYAALAFQIDEAFNAKFLPANGFYAADSQTAQAIPLFGGLVPEDRRDSVLAALVQNISETRTGHISAGIVGTLYVFHALQQAGRDDLAWKMLKQEDFPGWLNMVNHGATAFWEDWKGENSLNHPTLGCFGFWLYQGLGGIRPDPSAPGFKKIIVKPYIPKDLQWVKCSYDSAQGPIVVKWTRKGSSLELDVTVPGNSSATIHVPTSSVGSVTESGKKTSAGVGIQPLAGSDGFEVFEVGSGHYRFKSRL